MNAAVDALRLAGADHLLRAYGNPPPAPVQEETAGLLAWARGTLQAEIEGAALGPANSIQPALLAEKMGEFQAQWRDRPALRALIRAASDLADAEAERSALAWALREMSRSREWRREPGGMLPFDEFFDVVEQARQAHVDAVRGHG